MGKSWEGMGISRERNFWCKKCGELNQGTIDCPGCTKMREERERKLNIILDKKWWEVWK